MPDSLVDSWKSHAAQWQVIGQAELYPLLVARHTWKHFLHGRRVIFFQDNEGARLTMVKSYSPVLASLQIVLECISWDFQEGITPWYARVPTCANLADGPSRMSLASLPEHLRHRVKVVKPEFPNGVQPALVLEDGV